MVTESSTITDGYYLDNLVSEAQYLMQHGYSASAAAGIAGTTAGESGGNPESVGSGGAGLIGWTPPSSAAPYYPIVTGQAAQDFNIQLSDILDYNNQQGKSLELALNAQPTPTAAADFYSKYFERPAVTYSDVRPDVAKYVYAKLKGKSTSGILGSGSGGSSGTTTTSSGGGAGGGIVGDILDGLLHALGLSSVKDMMIRLGLILLGAALVIVGLAKMTEKPAVEMIGTAVGAAAKAP